ncbi:MAG TPA: archease [Gaiellaceae bacterium]|nr:archease [Gaiellaceae bacterium]
MTATWESHGAEEELHVVAPTPEQVVDEAAAALGRLVERNTEGSPARHELVVSGAGRAAQLVALLEELIFLADTEGFVADETEATFEEDRLRVHVRGRVTAVDPLVKAATYHGLSFEQQGDLWHARVVLDV